MPSARFHPWPFVFALAFLHCTGSSPAFAQQQHDDEIMANLAAGRVIIHVASESIIFAAIDNPIEIKSIPPRVMNLDGTHVGVLFGASEWQILADPKPVRLDRDFQHLASKDPKYEAYPDQAEPDLETIGAAFLEKLRPLVAQLHHKIDLPADQPLFEVVVIGYAPQDYGPEVWLLDYGLRQEEIAARGDYWQTRILRPRFTQLYPPEKHAPRTLIETRYPEDSKGPTLLELIQGNEPRVIRVAQGDRRFAKVVESINKGEAHKARAPDAAELMRALVPLVAGESRYVLAIIEQQHGFDWIVPPDEPIEKAAEDKNRPPGAPTLRRKPQL